MIKAFSYCCKNIPEEFINLQKNVFAHFNLEITQIIDDEKQSTILKRIKNKITSKIAKRNVANTSHGRFLEETFDSCKEDFIVFFDIDCIPLSNNLYDIILDNIEGKSSIIGIEQTGNPRFHIYAGPACLGVPRSLYFDLGKPNMGQTFRSDVAEELTWRCEEEAKEVKFFKVSDVEVPKWRLGYDRQFGIGTTYSYLGENVVYHQFEARLGLESFKRKCLTILNK